MDKKDAEKLEKLPFEKALQQLEKTVEKMESGELSLDQMIECFETGNTLSKICGKKLTALQKKIEVLVKDEGGEAEWKDFDSSSDRQNQMTIEPKSAEPKQDTGSDQTDSQPNPPPDGNGNLPF